MPDKIHLSKSAFDKALNPEASKYYRLSILLSQDGFSFCVYDQKNNKYAGLRVYDFQDVANNHALGNLISTLVPKDECLALSYEKVSVFFETPVSTLIPDPLFTPENTIEYLKLNQVVGNKDLVKTDVLPLLQARNIWAVPENLQKIILGFFPKAKLYHYASSLIESLLLQNKNKESGEIAFVYVRKNWFDITILDGNKLLFFNTFNYRAKEDFIYFLIFVFEQLNLNPEHIDVFLLGEVHKISSVYEMTYKYIRNIRFGQRSNNYQYSYVFDDIPEHFYFNLIHSHHCAL